MSSHERGRPEMTTFRDSTTGRTIQRLTHSAMEDKHTYYDISPWSPDGRTLLFSAAWPADVTLPFNDTLATHNGQVYTMDTESYELNRIAEDGFFNTHTGTFALWHPTANKVYYYTGPQEVAVVDGESGRRLHTMTGGIRQLSPDGATFAWSIDPPAPEGREPGIYTMNEDGSSVRLLVSTADLYALTPNRERFTLAQMKVGNTKWTPDSRHMLVAMWVKATPDDLSPWQSPPRRSLYIVSRDGSERRWLTYFGHHHSWTANGTQVLYSGYMEHSDDGVRRSPRLYLIDFDGGNQRIVVDEPLGGHPIASPDGAWITTWDDDGVILVDVAKQTVSYLAMLAPGFDMTHRGTHPHCIWSPDGRHILYNSAQTGNSQLYQITL